MENERGKALRKGEALENKSLKKKAKIGKGKSVREEDEDPSPEFDLSQESMLLAEELTRDPAADALYKRLKIRRRPNNTCRVRKHDPEKTKFIKRFYRNNETDLFRDGYKLVKGRKFLFSSEIDIARTGKLCYDSSWVAFHGFDSICTVTFRKAVDMKRLSAYYCGSRTEKEALLDFSEAVISDVECIPYNDYPYNRDILRQLCGGKVVKPFGVVSLVTGTEKRSWKEVIEPVRNFLKQKMQDSCLSFTDYETIQTAIGAFKHMCSLQELGAEDIWVTIMDVSSGRVDHLDIDTISEQLDIVNGCHSPTKSPVRPLFVYRGPMPRPTL